MTEVFFECPCGSTSPGRIDLAEAELAARVRGWGVIPEHPEYIRCPDCLQVKRVKPPTVLDGQLDLFDA